MKRVITWIGIGFGTGFSPKAPGTVGSLLAIVISSYVSLVHNIWFLILFSFVGIFITEISEKYLGKVDDSRIVFDEMVGQWIGVAGFSGFYLLAGFLLFRFFDIIKPGPIRNLQKFKGGLGIMLDDILAGICTWIILIIIKILL